MVEVLIALPLVFVLGLICHEIGHAVLFALCGHAVTAFGAGLGRPILVVPIGRSRFYLCRDHPLQGLTLTLSPPGLSRWRQALPLAGGILANFILAAVGWFWLRHGSWGLGAAWAFFSLNAFMGVVNAIPLRLVLGHSHHVVETDGLRLLGALLGPRRSESVAEILQSTAVLTPLLTAIRDDVLLAILKYRAALYWMALQNRVQAAAEVAAADALHPNHWPFTAQAAQLLRALALARLAPVDQAQTYIDEAEVVLQTLGEQGLMERLQLGLIRAELLQRREQWQAAAEAVEALLADPQFAAVPHLPLLAAANRTMAWAGAGDFQRAAAARGQLPAGADALLEFLTNRDLGRSYTRAGRPDEARAAYDRALEACRRLYEQFIDPEVRRLVRDGLQEFFGEARQAGALPAETPHDGLPEPAAKEALVHGATSNRDRRLGQVAAAVQLGNAAVMLSLIAMFLDAERFMASWRERGDWAFALVHAFQGQLGARTFYVLALICTLGLGLLVTAGEWLWCILADWHGTRRHHHRPGRRLLVNALWPWLLYGGMALWFWWAKPLVPPPLSALTTPAALMELEDEAP